PRAGDACLPRARQGRAYSSPGLGHVVENVPARLAGNPDLEGGHHDLDGQGVVARSEKQPAELLDIIIPDPGPNDVVVDIEATGVCHTDLAYRDGDINDEFPFLLGHESAGRVAVIGEDVTHVEVGDYVVLNWR